MNYGVNDNLILAVNSGSSSLKFGLFAERDGDETAILEGGADGIGSEKARLKISAGGKVLVEESYALGTQCDGLREVVNSLKKFGKALPVAVGHRVVHGGPHLRRHQPITVEVVAKLRAALHFAPVHIPVAVSLIQETERLLPQAQQFACFDTAFHTTMPDTSYRLPLSEELYEKGVQRYGFHGLSYESVVHRLGNKTPARVVCAHLGSGASLVALRDGRSIDTSMGLTPTGGIPMATRSGDLDPGVLLFLMRTEQISADGIETLLNRESGLVALSGGEKDMRVLEAKQKAGDAKAALAIDLFAIAVRKFIGAYAAALGGLDLLVFTGGIGEHSSYVRERICESLEFIGIKPVSSGEISKVMVMASQEEVQIARHCRRLLRERKPELAEAGRGQAHR
jgi:acetate kinase